MVSTQTQTRVCNVAQPLDEVVIKANRVDLRGPKRRGGTRPGLQRQDALVATAFALCALVDSASSIITRRSSLPLGLNRLEST